MKAWLYILLFWTLAHLPGQAQSTALQAFWKSCADKGFEPCWSAVEKYLIYHPYTEERDWHYLLTKSQLQSQQTAAQKALLCRVRGYLYYELGQIDSSEWYLKQAHGYYQQQKQPNEGAFYSLLLLGDLAFFKKQNIQQAMRLYEQAEKNIAHDSLRLFIAASKANVYTAEGRFAEAIEQRLSCIEIAEKYDKSEQLYRNKMLLGDHYYRNGMDEAAVRYTREALPGLKRLRLRHLVAYAYVTLADIAARDHQYSLAATYLDTSTTFAQQTPRKSYKMKLWASIANVYSNMEQYQPSLRLNYLALSLISAENQPVDYVGVSLSIASSYIELKRLDSAWYYVNTALPIAEEHRLLPRIRLAYSLLAHISYLQGRFTDAYYYQRQSLVYNDSIISVEKNLYAQELEAQYQFKQKEQEIIELRQANTIVALESENQRLENLKIQQELERKRQQQQIDSLRIEQEKMQRKRDIAALNERAEFERKTLELQVFNGRMWLAFSILTIFLIVTIGGVFFWRFRTKKRYEVERLEWEKRQKQLEAAQQEAYLAQKALQAELKGIKAQMNPHFIFNSLNSIQSFIFNNDKKNANHYLGQFSKLMRMVLDMSDQTTVPLDKELNLLRLYTELEALRVEDAHYAIEIDDAVDTDNVYLPSMLIQPHIENAFKHGLRQIKGRKQLWLRIAWEQPEQLLRVEIEDNGIGRKASQQQKAKNPMESHISFSTAANERRLQLLQQHTRDITTQWFDKHDEQGNPTGTKVVLFIPVQTDQED